MKIRTVYSLLLLKAFPLREENIFEFSAVWKVIPKFPVVKMTEATNCAVRKSL